MRNRRSVLPRQSLANKKDGNRKEVQGRRTRLSWAYVLQCSLQFFASFVLWKYFSPARYTVTSDSYIADIREKERGAAPIRDPYTINSLCLLDGLPPSWQRATNSRLKFSDSPWSDAEQKLADSATQKGLDELVEFYEMNATIEEIAEMSVDGPNSLIDWVYTTRTRNPAFFKQASTATKRMLKGIMEHRQAQPAKCRDLKDWLKFSAYSYYLVQEEPDDSEWYGQHLKLVNYTNSLLDRGCNESLSTIWPRLRVDRITETYPDPIKHELLVFRWIIAAICLVDARIVLPQLHLPPGVDLFKSDVWEYMNVHASKLFLYARHFKGNYNELHVQNNAWTATHVVYVPTGYGRHKQMYSDAPWLYDYIRENFYAALELGMLDLICEIVDLIKQYGCTAYNDVMVRDGQRFVLKLFKAANYSWIQHREPDEIGKEISMYDKIHKPWTAMSATQSTGFDPVVPGTNGYAFEQMIKKLR